MERSRSRKAGGVAERSPFLQFKDLTKRAAPLGPQARDGKEEVTPYT
jgi:hypothetical protein